ncbi:MAG: undecaprenyl-diphosphate phosphatase [Syntrophobacteraceae bacterium]|nr:undecaprenyl-diphosphate phosphatase [Syntrophobacteraceae bacterium]
MGMPPRWRLGAGLFMVLILLIGMKIGMAVASDSARVQLPGENYVDRGLTPARALVLGAVEGLTEYLPVSSTGHLLMAERLMGLYGTADVPGGQRRQAKTAADAYAICIQGGAILAVLGLYARRVRQMFLGLVGRDASGLKLAVNLGIAFLPAAVIGLLVGDLVKRYLFGPWPIVIAWLVGGLAILGMARWQRSSEGTRPQKALEELDRKMALLIGLVQCVAMWPGVSRSLATIAGGVLVGLSLPAAVEFSFLLGVVTLGAATGYDALKHGQDMLRLFDGSSIALGVISAFLFAVISVRWMVSYLTRHDIAIFGYYRIAVAVAAGFLMLTGRL